MDPREKSATAGPETVLSPSHWIYLFSADLFSLGVCLNILKLFLYVWLQMSENVGGFIVRTIRKSQISVPVCICCLVAPVKFQFLTAPFHVSGDSRSVCERPFSPD